VDKWALSADIRFRPKAVVPHSVHFRFRRAAVGKFGGCRK